MKSRHIVLRNDTLSTRDIWRGASTLSAGPGSQGLSAESLDIDRSTIPFLTRDASVLAVAPAMPMRLVSPFDTDGVPVEAEQTVTWGVHAVAADTSPFTGQGIVVAVLDTGIDSGHPAFAGIQVIQKDFTGEGNGDRHGHGTHCAGTIFGRAVNGTRIGVAPGVDKVLIGKVLDENGGGSSDGIVEAMLWAVEQGAHIISMSIGMDFGGYVKQLVESGMPVELATSRALEGYRTNTRLFDTLSDHIRARGMQAQPTVIIAAAGNESQRDVSPDFEVAVSPPAVAEGIVSVAALGDTAGGYSTAPFSNTGANVSGPGVSIISAALGGGLRKMSGTSMATPHVAGVAALWAQQLSERGAHNVFNLIGRLAGTASSERLQEGFDPFDVGAGLVQSPQAM